MMTSSFINIILLVVVILLTSSSSVVVEAFKLPRGTLGPILYNKMFASPPDGDATYYCVALANQKVSDKFSSIAGCSPPNYIETLPLVALELDDWRTALLLASSGSSSSSPSYKTLEQAALAVSKLFSLDEASMLVVPASIDFSCSFLFRVLLRLLDSPYSMKDKIRGMYFAYQKPNAATSSRSDMCSMSELSSSSPLQNQSPYYSSPPQDWAIPTTSTLSKNTSGLLNGLLWKNLNLTLIQIDLRNEPQIQFWDALMKRAIFNMKKKNSATTTASAAAAVEFVSQADAAMNYVQYTDPQTASGGPDFQRDLTCLTRGKCLPVGGLSTWASTRAEELPRSNLDERLLENNKTLRGRRTVAIVVPSTSTSLFHENAPGANAAASGIVAALAVADAITNSPTIQELLRLQIPLSFSSEKFWEPTHIHFFFSVGDEYGLQGTGRLVSELITMNCSAIVSLPNETEKLRLACREPAYSNLNFTATDLQEYTHIIALEQLLVGDDVFLHTDKVSRTNKFSPNEYFRNASFDFSSSSSQQAVRNFFTSSSSSSSSKKLQESASNQLPPNSLFSFFEVVSAKNSRLALGDFPSFSNSSQQEEEEQAYQKRWSGQFNETTLFSLSAFNDKYSDYEIQSGGDIGFVSVSDKVGQSVIAPRRRRNNITLIQKASQAIVNFLVEFIWKPELTNFCNSNFYNSSSSQQQKVPSSQFVSSLNATVNETLLRQMWNCLGALDEGTCRDLGTSAASTFYPGVFQGYRTLPTKQQRFSRAYIDQWIARIHEPINNNNNDTENNNNTLTCSSPECSRDFWSVCSIDGRCIRQRAFWVHSFSPACDYGSDGAFLTTKPTENMTNILPFALLEKAPIWTESNWRTLETRIAQQQVYDSSALLGVVIAFSCVLFGFTYWIVEKKI